MTNFEVGNTVEIVDNISGHGFEIGEEVLIKEVDADGDNDSYIVENEEDFWYVSASEMKIIKKGEIAND